MHSRFALLILLILTACSSTQKTAATAESAQEKSIEPKIVFAGFLISKQPEKESKIELISVTESKGKLKKNTETKNSLENYLTLEIISPEAPKQIIRIEHPLYKTVEYVNDEHKLTAQYVETDEADFFIRFQKTGNTQIKVFETRKKQTKELKTFKI
ncbi:MAG: hypothetical protein JST78_01985 [Bacteroidetes bacterium]|nr:hypothetical protein [Bacteroidota bacterium]